MSVETLVWTTTRLHWIFPLAMAAVLVTGCGKGSGKGAAANADQADEDSGETEIAAAGPSKDRKGIAKKKPAPGKKIGAIPIDVWPEVWLKDPLAVAAEKGPAAGAAPVATGDADPQVAKSGTDKPAADTEKPSGASGAAPAADGGQWTALISGETLADETKAIKNSLADKLQNKGRYDSTYKELRVDAAVLVCLASLAGEHPDAPSWKKNAKYIRDMASEISNGSTANGEKFFLKVRGSYDKLDELLSGNKPAGLEESADNLRFSEVAKRNFLMLRMQRAIDTLKATINTEAILKKESAKVGHESAVVALLAKIITTPGFDSADDPEYQKFTDVVTKSSLEVGAAAKDQDFKAYTSALDRCMKSCDKCHLEFRP